MCNIHLQFSAQRHQNQSTIKERNRQLLHVGFKHEIRGMFTSCTLIVVSWRSSTRVCVQKSSSTCLPTGLLTRQCKGWFGYSKNPVHINYEVQHTRATVWSITLGIQSLAFDICSATGKRSLVVALQLLGAFFQLPTVCTRFPTAHLVTYAQGSEQNTTRARTS